MGFFFTVLTELTQLCRPNPRPVSCNEKIPSIQRASFCPENKCVVSTLTTQECSLSNVSPHGACETLIMSDYFLEKGLVNGCTKMVRKCPV